MTTSPPPPSPLFTIPIAPCGGDAHPGGTITCTQPAPRVYLLTWSSPPDNRITTPFCRALLAALDALEMDPRVRADPAGVVVTTSAIRKFYSNGLDLRHAIETEGFWALLYQVWKRFLTFPMPTVALLNGHTYAGGLMLAMAHDYRLAPRDRGYLCLNELLFGAPLKPPMAAIFRHKLPPATLRELALEARRFSGPEAVAAGLADATAGAAGGSGSGSGSASAGAGAASSGESVVAGLDDALAFIRDRGLVEKAKSGFYGVIRAELYAPLVAILAGAGLDAEERRFDADQRAEAERKEFAKVWYDEWRKDQKAKL